MGWPWWPGRQRATLTENGAGVGTPHSKRAAVLVTWCSLDPLAQKEEKAHENQTRGLDWYVFWPLTYTLLKAKM